MADKIFEVGFITFVITSLVWALIWSLATIVRLSDKKDKD
jgi:hypothetical protein